MGATLCMNMLGQQHRFSAGLCMQLLIEYTLAALISLESCAAISAGKVNLHQVAMGRFIHWIMLDPMGCGLDGAGYFSTGSLYLRKTVKNDVESFMPYFSLEL